MQDFKAYGQRAHFRWWLITRTTEPTHVLSYGEAILAASRNPHLHIIGCDHTNNIVNQACIISLESHTNTLVALIDGAQIRLFPQNQVTPETTRISGYWFSGEALDDVVTFQDIEFSPKDASWQAATRLELHGEIDSFRHLNMDQGAQIANLVKLADDGTCFAVCIVSGTIRQHYLLERPAGRAKASVYRARPYYSVPKRQVAAAGVA